MDRPGVHVDEIVGEWRRRMAPPDDALARAISNDPYHQATLEIIRRTCRHFDRAMELEEIPEETRRRVLSIVMLGDPSGLDDLEARRIEKLYESMLLNSPPRPIYFNPYSIPFHPDEPFPTGKET